MTKSLRRELLIDITGARNLWTLFTLYVSNHCIWYSFVNNIWKALLKSDGAGRRNVRFYVLSIRPCHPHLRFNLKLTKAKTEDRLFLSNKSLTDYVTDCRQNVSRYFGTQTLINMIFQIQKWSENRIKWQIKSTVINVACSLNGV